ncbi:hypothetical protein [Haloferula sp.]
MATGASAVVLLGAGFWNYMTIARLPLLWGMYAEMDSGELPLISRLVFRIGEIYVFHVLSLVLLLLGFFLLFATKEQLRGVVYSLVISLLLVVITTVVREASWLPMAKIMQSLF